MCDCGDDPGNYRLSEAERAEHRLTEEIPDGGVVRVGDTYIGVVGGKVRLVTPDRAPLTRARAQEITATYKKGRQTRGRTRRKRNRAERRAARQQLKRVDETT